VVFLAFGKKKLWVGVLVLPPTSERESGL